MFLTLKLKFFTHKQLKTVNSLWSILNHQTVIMNGILWNGKLWINGGSEHLVNQKRKF